MPSSDSSPPSYTTQLGSQEERLYAQHSSSYPAKFDVFPDTKSTKSRSVADTPSADLAALKSISGGRVRKGKCPPEFLAEVAKAGIPNSVIEKYGSSKFKIVVGKEALEFYERFIGKGSKYPPSQLYDETISRKDIPPLVFAIPVYDAVGRKCIDYYMSWRRYLARVTNSSPPPPRVHDVRDAERRCSFLDGEFKLLGVTLDKEYKKARRAATSSRASSGSMKSSSSSRKGDRIYQLKENVAPSTPPRRPTPPELTVPEPAVSIPESPVSANASVISIPTLTMIRGVPRSHHLPLRVANPDPETSTIDEAPERASRSLETLVETAENAGSGNENAASEETFVHQTSSVPPVVIRPPSSDASSSDRSSRSSKSSGSRESRRHRDRDRDDEGRHHHHHDSSGRHSSSREHDNDRHHEKKHSSKHDDSRKKRTSPMGNEEFIIVVLDDKLCSGVTWHGIERQPSTTRAPSRAPSTRSSPWSGPLAQQDFITRRYSLQRSHNHSPLDSGESEEESSDSEIEGLDDAPVIPLKAYMEAMGYVSPAAHASYPVVTPSMQYQQRPPLVTNFSPQTQIQSPPTTAYNSPYPIVNSSLPTSPYVSAWMKLTPQQQHTPLARSPYAQASPSIYASPYGQPHQVAPY